MSKIEMYYDGFDEWKRLCRHPVELGMTKRMLDKFVPEGISVLDVGGGPGRYSIYLAAKGHRVTLVDLSAEMVRQAEVNAAEAGVDICCVKGSALELSTFLRGKKFGTVLCMGPLYHLLQEIDRIKAVEQCMELLQDGGIFIASFISAYAPLVDCLADYPQQISDLKHKLLGYLEDGKCIPEESEGFTDAYFIRPGDIGRFMSSFPLEPLRIMSLDGPGTLVEANLKQLGNDDFESWLDVFEAISCSPEVWGCCEHMLFIGKKRGC